MGTMGTVGSIDVGVQASTRNAAADLEAFGGKLAETGRIAKVAAESAAAGLGKMTIASEKARFAAMMQADTMREAAAATRKSTGEMTAAHERLTRAWQREKVQQDLALDAQRETARSMELAAMKAKMLADANAAVAESTNPVIAAFQRESAEVSEAFGAMGERIAAVAERAELSADGIAAGFGGLGKLLGAGIAGDLALHTLDNVAELNVMLGDLHEKTGIAVQDLAGLRLMAQSKGLDFTTISMGLIRLGKAMYEAKQGMLEDREAFSSLGISMKEVNTLSVEQMLYRISAALGENRSLVVADGTALELFGRGGKEMVPMLREWGSGLKDVVKQQGKLTGVTEQSKVAAQQWLQATSDLSAEFHAGFNPVLVELVRHMGALESVARSVDMAVVGVFGTMAEAAWNTLASFNALGKALSDIAEGNFKGAGEVIVGRFHAAVADFKALRRSESSDYAAMRADWAASGHLPVRSEPNFPNRSGDVDGVLLHNAKQQLAEMERKHPLTHAQLVQYWQGVLAKARPGSTDYEQVNLLLGSLMQHGAAGAASLAMKVARQNLASQQARGDLLTPGEQAQYWMGVAKKGSPIYGEALMEAHKAQTANWKAGQASMGSRMRDDAAWFKSEHELKPRDLSRDAGSMQNESADSRASAQYISDLKRMGDIQDRNAASIAEASIEMQVATGRMTRLDAAQAKAALHAQEFTSSLADLRSELLAIDGMPISSIQKKMLESGIANKIATLNGQRAVQAMQDQASIDMNTPMGATRAAISQMVASWTDMTQQLAEILPRSLETVNESLAHSLMAHAYTGYEYRRGIVQSMSNAARSIGSGLLGMGMHEAEGGILSKLGFGPKKKPMGTHSDPLYVRMADAQANGSGALSSILSQAGMPSGLATATKGVTSLIPSLLGAVLPGFAAGGTIPSGLPAIVGEQGPELFVPSTSGRIVPNDQLGMGDTHFHMPVTIDARGATDPSAVHAAVSRAMEAWGPRLVSASVQAVHEHKMRRPSMAH